MVHALRKIHRFLAPRDGVLIDIHPRVIPRPLIVRVDQREYLVEHLTDAVRFERYAQADAALESLVVENLYHLDSLEHFVFNVYFDTSAELVDYLSEDDSNNDPSLHPSPDSSLVTRVKDYLQLPGTNRVILLQRPVTIRQYRPISNLR